MAQHPGRRWFSDDYFDLIVWYDVQGEIAGMQLCYDKQGHERALTWTRDGGVKHERVDTGEPSPVKNMAPILVPDGVVPFCELLTQFRARSGSLEPALVNAVLARLFPPRA